jgi:hypothetical protein
MLDWLISTHPHNGYVNKVKLTKSELIYAKNVYEINSNIKIVIQALLSIGHVFILAVLLLSTITTTIFITLG